MFVNQHRYLLLSRSKRLLPGRRCCLLLFFLITAQVAGAKNLIAWTGSISSDWNTPGNWSPQIVPGAADEVQIGLTSFAVSAQPLISAAAQCASLTFGAVQPVQLTISAGASLTVGGAVILVHSETDQIPAASLTGAGTMSCGSLQVGNMVLAKLVKDKTTRLQSSLAELTVTGNVVLNSATVFLLSGGLAHNQSLFSITGGEVTVNGQIRLTNLVPDYLSGLLAGSVPSSRISLDITSGQSPKLKVLNNIPLSISHSDWNTADYDHDLAGTANGTVEYGGADQVIATGATAGLDVSPAPYAGLVISGSGTKHTESSSGDQLITAGALRIVSSTLDMQTNQASLRVGGDFSNAGTALLGNTTFLGADFNNTSVLMTSTALIRFEGADQALAENTATGTAMNNVNFLSGTKSLKSGEFILPAGGTWTIADKATLFSVAPGAQLVFRSAAAGPPALVFADPGSPAGIAASGRSSQVAASLKPNSARGVRKLVTPVKTVRTATATGSRPEKVISLGITGKGGASAGLQVRFSERAIPGYRVAEDVRYTVDHNPGGIFYCYSSDHIRLSASSLALPEKTGMIGLYIDAAQTGEYSLDISGLKGVPQNYRVLLKDALNGGTIDLRQQEHYSFRVDKAHARSYGNRFELLIIRK